MGVRGRQGIKPNLHILVCHTRQKVMSFAELETQTEKRVWRGMWGWGRKSWVRLRHAVWVRHPSGAVGKRWHRGLGTPKGLRDKAMTKYSENIYVHFPCSPCKHFSIFQVKRPSLLLPSNFKGKTQTGKFLYSNLRKVPRLHDIIIALWDQAGSRCFCLPSNGGMPGIARLLGSVRDDSFLFI